MQKVISAVSWHRTLNMRNTPEIQFILDQSIEYGVNMSKKIDEVTKDLKDRRVMKMLNLNKILEPDKNNRQSVDMCVRMATVSDPVWQCISISIDNYPDKEVDVLSGGNPGSTFYRIKGTDEIVT